MNNFILGINVIFPLFFVLFTGLFLKKIKIIDDRFINQSTNLIFYVTMPASLVMEVKNSDLSGINLSYIIYLLLGVLVMFGGTWAIARFFIEDNKKLSAFVHCAYRSNFLYVGVPILKAIKPDYQMAPVLAAMIFGVALFNIIGTLFLTYYSENDIIISELIIKVLKNPVIVAMFIGLILKFINFPVPNTLERGIKVLGNLNTPLALIMIGGSLNFNTRKNDLLLVSISALIKNVIGAAILVPLAFKLNFNSSEIVVAYILFGTPCAINCFVMGKKLGSDELMTSQIITLSYALSLFTFAGGIAILKNFGVV
ncbi:MAG: AEC family transporter [Peptoniphilus sp.]|uniref:AEC family transporter n=1 Tax=Peptoniphilus sp. TaxID=1971214 RepID=UPI002A74F4A4|nr:AEC family transporter [Peptoniphilus sp.]MDY2987411.1 AEC family transporter [Peptoniphilus sp.]